MSGHRETTIPRAIALWATLSNVLALIFVMLKLTHTIAWSWLWVLSPLWIGAALAVVFFVVFLGAVALWAMLSDG
jgi:hypothetical protein